MECIDYNECDLTGFCANGRCLNADGSFRCVCDDGFALSPSGLSCVDVDECAENPLVCLRGGRCRNAPGGYVCECLPGYTHSSDGAFCLDENECALDGDMCAHGRCVNEEGGFRCVCDPGYGLSPGGRTCVDLDECRSGPCVNGRCENTEGGFTCRCNDGFALGPDGRTCTGNSYEMKYYNSADRQIVQHILDSLMAPCFQVFGGDGRCSNQRTVAGGKRMP